MKGEVETGLVTTQKSVFGARKLVSGGPSAALRTRLAAFGPSAKSVGRPLFLSYQFPPTFPHSPPSARGGHAEAANPVSGGSSTDLGNGSARSEPLQKVSADPYFYSTSSPPLFPTLHTRRSGVVLRARGSGSAARAPRSLPGLLGLGLGG